MKISQHTMYRFSIHTMAVAAISGVILSGNSSPVFASGILHACFPNDGGRVRIVESALDCRNTETAISWNAQGPQGPKGDTGDSGILVVAGTSCNSGEVLTGFDSNGAIICSELNGSGSSVVGDDCGVFRANWLNGGIDDAPGADLRGCDLRGLSISNFNFAEANFAGADLRGAQLEGLNLTSANFSGANLEGAYLVGSELRATNFTDANLSHANLGCEYGPTGDPLNCTLFVNAIIDRAIFTGANLRDSVAFPPHNDQPFLPVRPVFGDTICPDGTNSFDDDGDAGTCSNNILP